MPRRPRSVRPRVENLEDRTTPSRALPLTFDSVLPDLGTPINPADAAGTARRLGADTRGNFYLYNDLVRALIKIGPDDSLHRSDDLVQQVHPAGDGPGVFPFTAPLIARCLPRRRRGPDLVS